MKILLAVDGSIYTQRMLAYLATHPGLLGDAPSITALHTVPQVSLHSAAMAGPERLEIYYEEEAEGVLASVRTQLASHGVEAEILWKVGQPGDKIASYAHEGGFDLVVMGSHGHGALKNLVLGSVANQVLARCNVPVLVVR